MSDRRRKAGSADSSQDCHRRSIRTKLSVLNQVQSHAEDSISNIETLHQNWQDLAGLSDEDNNGVDDDIDDEKDDQRNEIVEKLEKAYAKLSKETQTEKSLSIEALESLGILVALRTPDQLQVSDAYKWKKRRIDGNSPALSEISTPGSASTSPAPPVSGPIQPDSRAGVNASVSETTPVSITSRTSSPNLETPQPQFARTPGSRPLTKKERRDVLNSQLPLKEGRPVAFRPPGKAQFKGTKNEGGSTDWIQARVVKCIQGDKNRYEVQDVDDADGEGKAGASFNTTLKAIIVLPDPRDRTTYPPSPYSIGHNVIALYPETTSFYKAKVVGLPNNNSKLDISQKAQYKLVFDDDNDEIKNVSVDYVVDMP